MVVQGRLALRVCRMEGSPDGEGSWLVKNNVNAPTASALSASPTVTVVTAVLGVPDSV